MNARTQVFELTVEARQVEEVARIVPTLDQRSCIFHTLLFHRALGKFHYKQEASYSVGTIGYEDVDCDFIDLTYVKCASDRLDERLQREVRNFYEMICADNSASGQISLEFFQKKKTRWPFPAECIPWEIWTIKVNIITLSNEHEKQIYREKIGEVLAEKILYIAEAMNRHEYVPKMPNQSELDLVFDTTFPDVQPYLFKFSYQTLGPNNASVGTTVRKLLKDTLAL